MKRSFSFSGEGASPWCSTYWNALRRHQPKPWTIENERQYCFTKSQSAKTYHYEITLTHQSQKNVIWCSWFCKKIWIMGKQIMSWSSLYCSWHNIYRQLLFYIPPISNINSKSMQTVRTNHGESINFQRIPGKIIDRWFTIINEISPYFYKYSDSLWNGKPPKC